MKKLIFAAALMMGSAAFAQETPPAETPPAPTEVPPTETAPPPAETMPPPAGAAPAPAPTEAAPPAGAAKQFGTPPTVDQKYPPPAPKAEYPWCSKTVTDGCKQRRSPK